MYTQTDVASKTGLCAVEHGFLAYQNQDEYVFGKVTKGMDVVKKIESTQTRTVGPFENVPTHDMVIEKVEQIKSTK